MKKSAGSKKTAAGRKTAKKSPTKRSATSAAARKPVRKAATKAGVSKAAKARARAAKPAGKRAAAKKAPAKKVAAKKVAARKSPAKKMPVKKVAAKKTAATKVPVNALKKTMPPTMRKPSAAPPSQGAVSPEVAIAHFQQLLRAKQERVRQGPTYPAANPYSGRHDALAAEDHRDNDDNHAVPAAGTPEPEAVYGANATHGRGNQGMRKPK